MVIVAYNKTVTSFQLLLFLFALLHAILLLSIPVTCNDEEDDLFHGINIYRASLNLSALTKNDNAECVADKIAEQLEEQPCTSTNGVNAVPGNGPQISNYPDLLKKCRHLNLNNTKDGIILAACVPDLVPTLVLSNFTRSRYSRYLNDTKYTGAGIGSEEDWIVVVLSTNTPGGSFVSYNGACLIPKVGLSLLLGVFLVLVN